jgi:hypothetical protein
MNDLLVADKSMMVQVKRAIRIIVRDCLDYYPLNGEWATVGVGVWINTPRRNNEFVLMLADKEVGTVNLALLHNRKK